MRDMKSLCFVFLMFFHVSGLVFSQTLIQGVMSGWAEEQSGPPSFLFMYEALDGVVGNRTLIDILPVNSEGSFSFSRPLTTTRVYEFEAPPWSWKILSRPNGIESDTLTLHKSSVGPTRLRRVMSKSNWGPEHPSWKYDRLRMFAAELDELAMYDRMALSGAVGGGTRLVDLNYTDSLDLVFEDACTNLLADSAFIHPSHYRDLVFALRLQWKRDSGLSTKLLRQFWQEESIADTARTILEKVQSQGWCSSWIEVNKSWYQEVAPPSDLIAWVSNNNSDSIALALGCALDEVALAMWWWELSEPNPIASLWWLNNANSPLSSLRMMKGSEVWSALDLVNQVWTTPALDLISLDELEGKWAAILVVKSGSSASMREWSAFRAVERSMQSARNDIQFVVLSIDGTRLAWEELVDSRQSSSDMLRWVGADTRWLDGLSIESIPQTIILSPTLEVHSVSTRLPSQGLGQVLIKLK